ncbi:hypothetical protein SprV_0100285600 [Sparganum proliferum]
MTQNDLPDTRYLRQFLFQQDSPKLSWPDDVRPLPDEMFHWTSVDTLVLPQNDRSYILLGGSYRPRSTSKNAYNVFPRENGIVILCTLTKDRTGKLIPAESCYDIASGLEKRGFLGASVATLQLTFGLGLFAYCDPLWSDDGKLPAGRCYLQLIHGQRLRPRHELRSFCRTGGKVTEPCMTGFSVSLTSSSLIASSISQAVRDIRVSVGQPLAAEFGQVQMVTDPYNTSQLSTVHRPKSFGNANTGGYFGFSQADGYVGAPSYGKEDTVPLGNSDIFHLFRIGDVAEGSSGLSWLGKLPHNASFSGYGTSIVRLRTVDQREIVVVGLPYAAAGGTKANSGAIMVYCTPIQYGLTANYAARVRMPNETLRAPSNTSFFGYTLSAVGDIDGDGIDELAVGAPNLSDEQGIGKIFLLRLFPNCTFDRYPLDVLSGPSGDTLFGSVLPPKSDDLNFDGWPELVVPPARTLPPLVFFSRPQYRAKCRFDTPPWLSTVQVRNRTVIPVKATVDLQAILPHQQVQTMKEIFFFGRTSASDLIHQFNPDAWASEPGHQRIKLDRVTNVRLDELYNKLLVEFTLKPQMHVEDMPALEQPGGELRVYYRFIMPCPPEQPWNAETGTCSENAWLHRPKIDWSGCSFKLPVTRYVCFPQGKCESNVGVRLRDQTASVSASVSGTKSMVKESSKSNESKLVFGDRKGAHPQLLVEVFNAGPTFAGGVWISLSYFGNLHFSSLEIGQPSSVGDVNFVEFPCSHVANNESFVACKIGRIDAQRRLEANENHFEPAVVFRLTSFYNFGNVTQMVDYTEPSGVSVSVNTATWDSDPSDNTAQWRYTLQNRPTLLISHGANPPPSVVDNRTQPAPWEPAWQQRIWVDELGPRMVHSYQVENIGSLSRLLNVTLQIRVPVLLEENSHRRRPLVYLFEEVRSPSNIDGDLDWFHIGPTVQQIGNPNNTGIKCEYEDANLLNPWGLIAIDMNENAHLRLRREVFEDNLHMRNESLGSVSSKSVSSKPTTPEQVKFRRVPKEVVQCNRRGRQFGTPVCLNIICRVPELVKQQPVRVIITGWIYARTFFELSTSDVEIVTSMTADQGFTPAGVIKAPEPVGHFEIAQTFYFPQSKPKLLRQIPIWPIIVGLVLGIILLALLIILLYRFGFFRRRKHILTKSARANKNAHLAAVTAVNNADETDNGGFGTLLSVEAARKRRRKLLKHPEEVSILHPDDLRKANINELADEPTPL